MHNNKIKNHIIQYDLETQMSYYIGYHYNHIPNQIIILDN